MKRLLSLLASALLAATACGGPTQSGSRQFCRPWSSPTSIEGGWTRPSRRPAPRACPSCPSSWP